MCFVLANVYGKTINEIALAYGYIPSVFSNFILPVYSVSHVQQRAYRVINLQMYSNKQASRMNTRSRGKVDVLCTFILHKHIDGHGSNSMMKANVTMTF